MIQKNKKNKRIFDNRDLNDIKKDKVQQKIYNDNVKFIAGMFSSYEKRP